MSPTAFVDRLATGPCVAAPGVYDGMSAMLAERVGVEAVYVSGYCVAASRFAMPDAGLIGLRDMVEAIVVVRRVYHGALVADADNGYGGLLNVKETVRQFEDCGVGAIQIEDQEAPKRCGDAKGKRVVSIPEMVARIEVAVESRRQASTLIIARTDARSVHGLDDALARAQAYRSAGADMLFVSSPASIEEVRLIGQTLPGPLVLNLTPPRGFVHPNITLAEVDNAGFRLAIYPGLLAFSGIDRMHRVLRQFELDGRLPSDALDPGFALNDLVGFATVEAGEARWASRFGD